MANPQLGSIGNFPTLLLSRRHDSLFTGHWPPIPFASTTPCLQFHWSLTTGHWPLVTRHSPPTDPPKSGSFTCSIPPSFRRTNQPISRNWFPADRHSPLPACRSSPCGQGRSTPGALGLPACRLSDAVSVTSLDARADNVESFQAEDAVREGPLDSCQPTSHNGQLR